MTRTISNKTQDLKHVIFTERTAAAKFEPIWALRNIYELYYTNPELN
jgi:hypothetical protein